MPSVWGKYHGDMMKTLKSPVLIMLFCALANTVLADDNLQDTMVVTASRMPEQERAIPQAVTVIDQEQLQKNQYEDLADLLQNYGFNVISYGPNQSSSQISIRGMDTAYSNPFDSNVQVLINGAPFASTNLSMLPIDGIERVEILRGPGAVQYGSSAIGGVINIIPKQGTEKFHLSAEAGGGTWQAYRAMASTTGKIKFFDFAGSVNWNTQKSNYTTGDGKLYPDTSVDGRLGYLLNFGVNLNSENRVGVVLSGVNDWGLGLSQNLETQERYPHFDPRLRHINSSFDASYDGGYRDYGLSWKFRYFNAYDQANYTYPENNPLYNDNYAINIDQQGVQAQLSWIKGFFSITGGVDHTDSSYSSGFSPRYSQKDTAGFLMTKFAFFDDFLVISGGLRYDSYIFRVDGRQKDMDNTSLSAGVAINPFDWLTIRSNIGQSFKAPSGIYVVGYESPSGNVTGNSGLEPEKGLGWDAGIDVHYRGLKAGLTYFSTDYRDKITSRQISPGNYFYYNSSGTSRYRGLEGQFSFDFGEFFQWDFMLKPYLNFTKLLEYEDQDGDRLFHVRDFVASFGLNFDYPELGLDMDLRFNYLGYQKEHVFDSNYNESEKRTGNKTVADFFISKTIWDFQEGGKLSLKGEIRNITNENYSYHYDYPLPGRSFYVGIRYDF